MATEAGQLQLNAMKAVIFSKIMEIMTTMTNAMQVLATRCVDGIKVDRARCTELLGGSLVLATELVPIIGYDATTRLAKFAQTENIKIRAAAESQCFLTSDQVVATLQTIQSDDDRDHPSAV